MVGKNLFKVAAVVAAALACMPMSGCREHPGEHPSASQGSDLTKEQLADAIEAYIQKQAAAHDGAFPIVDEKSGQDLHLTLIRVHRERLAKVGADHYFACVDFKSPEGKVYDVDFFMKGTDKDNLAFSEFMIHKEDGKERYTWYQENGIWRRKPVGEAGQPAEKPKEQPKEHPTEHPTEHPSEHPK